MIKFSSRLLLAAGGVAGALAPRLKEFVKEYQGAVTQKGLVGPTVKRLSQEINQALKAQYGLDGTKGPCLKLNWVEEREWRGSASTSYKTKSNRVNWEITLNILSFDPEWEILPQTLLHELRHLDQDMKFLLKNRQKLDNSGELYVELGGDTQAKDDREYYRDPQELDAHAIETADHIRSKGFGVDVLNDPRALAGLLRNFNPEAYKWYASKRPDMQEVWKRFRKKLYQELEG